MIAVGVRRNRLLVVFPDHPEPQDMGNRVRNIRILEALAPEFDLVIVSVVRDRASLTGPSRLAELGRWVPLLAPHRRSRGHQVARHLRFLTAGFMEGLHRETYFQSPPELSAHIREVLNTHSIDLVHSAYWYSLRHLTKRPRPPLWVVDTHDVQFERHSRVLGRDSPRERAAEINELRRYDRLIAITEHDRRSFARVLPDGPPIEVIEMGLDLAHWTAEVPPELPPAPRIAFYGNLGTPANHAAAVDLVTRRLSVLAPDVPGLQLLLLGASPSAELRSLAGRAAAPTLVTGFVDDPRPFLRASTVVALPLRGGSGQRGRVLECLAAGVPVVATSEAIEGLDLRVGEGILIARDDAELESQLRGLLRAPERARALGAAGRRRVEERYGWARTYGRFPICYREWIDATRRRGPLT